MDSFEEVGGQPALRAGLGSDFLTEVAKGNIPGYSLVHKFGRNSAVSTTLVPICDGGFYRTPTGTVTLEAISDDTNDTAAGTGAQEITLQYLDSNFDLQVGTIEMNGTTASTETLAGVKRLVRIYVSRSGTYASQSAGSQKGTITVRVSGGGDTWATLPEIGTSGMGVGQSLIGSYTVPAGKTAYILSGMITVDSNKSANLYFFKRENADDTSAPYTGTLRLQNVYTGLSGFQEIDHKTYESYPEKTDIGWMGIASTAADVSVEFELLLVDN